MTPRVIDALEEVEIENERRCRAGGREVAKHAGDVQTHGRASPEACQFVRPVRAAPAFRYEGEARQGLALEVLVPAEVQASGDREPGDRRERSGLLRSVPRYREHGRVR